ncbi:MAG TPA: biotin/lipoyl-containing protein [Pyrinomonadaceae bacterium]|nr:biotin/lipoyl-containing protein [Pyrinomonadaceae bacterium]
MKLIAQQAGADHDISLAGGESSVSANVDGRIYGLQVRELGHGEYLLINGTKAFRCRVDTKHNSRNSFEVVLLGHSYDISIVDPKRLRSGDASGVQDHGTAKIISPMPGKVVRVLVEQGAQVEAGEGIVVVEAMKMQNELKSPKKGVVSSINAEVGVTVNAGDVLAVIE